MSSLKTKSRLPRLCSSPAKSSWAFPSLFRSPRPRKTNRPATRKVEADTPIRSRSTAYTLAISTSTSPSKTYRLFSSLLENWNLFNSKRTTTTEAVVTVLSSMAPSNPPFSFFRYFFLTRLLKLKDSGMPDRPERHWKK